MSDTADELIAYDVVALSELEDPSYEVLKVAVRQALDRFECGRSGHLQEFARSNVHKYERHGHSRTYVFITPVEGDGIDVPAFFTVGMTSLDLSKATNSQKKRLSGDISMDTTGAYSIAELARSDRYKNSQLPGSAILKEAMHVVRQARVHVGGRFAVVDARKEVFDQLYEPAGFKRLHVTDPPIGMESIDFLTACCVVKDY